MDPARNVATIATETGKTGPDLAEELVRRRIAADLEEALLMVALEVDDGPGDIVEEE